MENLRQVVLQILTSPYERALAQYGNETIPSFQVEIKYEELNSEEKKIWDDFVNMIKTKS